MSAQYLAIHDKTLLAEGSLKTLVNVVKAISVDIEPIVLETGSLKRIEINWHGDAQAVLSTLSAEHEGSTPKKRGRPKLGVTSKEITLLPRHWEWLSTQRGGASVTIRRLIDEARQNPSVEEVIALKQQRLDSFMELFLGDEIGYEEASHALFRNSRVSFEAATESWPTDLSRIAQATFNEIAILHDGEGHQNRRNS